MSTPLCPHPSCWRDAPCPKHTTKEARPPRSVSDLGMASLFDPPPLPKPVLARLSDTSTSQSGEASVRLRAPSQKARLLVCYDAADGGLTDEEASLMAGLQTGGWKRCSDLRTLGLIADTGRVRLSSAGCEQMVCAITDAGRRAHSRGA